MEYLSEVLKILDGALKANASMAANYAGYLQTNWSKMVNVLRQIWCVSD